TTRVIQMPASLRTMCVLCAPLSAIFALFIAMSAGTQHVEHPRAVQAQVRAALAPFLSAHAGVWAKAESSIVTNLCRMFYFFLELNLMERTRVPRPCLQWSRPGHPRN